jgi:hypothetical protein
MKITRTLLTCALAANLTLAGALAGAQTLRAESGNPATFNSQLATMMSKYARQDHGISIQINTVQAQSKNGVKVGSVRTDLTIIPTQHYTNIGERSHIYDRMVDQALKDSDNIRSLF